MRLVMIEGFGLRSFCEGGVMMAAPGAGYESPVADLIGDRSWEVGDLPQLFTCLHLPVTLDIGNWTLEIGHWILKLVMTLRRVMKFLTGKCR